MERLSQKLQQETECSLCIETIKQPKILPCHHGFCCECLNKIADSRRQMNQTTFDCPECKASFTLPENDRFDSFPSSFHHNRLLDLLALAEVNKASQKCSSCELREMDYCCDECNVCICAKCGISGHKDHMLIDIEDAATQNKQRIAEMLVRVKDGVRACKQSIERDKFNFKAAGEHRNAVKSKISSRVEELISALRTCEVDLGRELDNLYEEQQRKHLVEHSDLELNLASLDSYFDYGEMLLRKNVTWELAKLDECVLQSGEELLGSMKGQGCNYVTGELVTNEELVKTVLRGSFGRVVKSNTDPAYSIADGEGLREAICGEQAEFTVVTKDSGRNTCYYEGDQISVDVKSIHGNEAEVQIEDCKDGTYRVMYVPRTNGHHLMSVKVKGRRLLCVPGFVHVTPHQYRAEKSFGSHGSGKGQFTLPTGIAVSSIGELAVADYGNGRVQLFTSDGVYLTEFGSSICKPTSVAYTRADDIIVMDGAGEKALSAALYTNRGVFMKEFGPSFLDSARSVSITREGHAAVCQWENRSIKILSDDGEKLLRSFKSVDSAMFPSNVADHKSRYFASYPLTGLVKVWNKAGKFLFDIGKPGAGMVGKLVGPLGLTIDVFGNLVVCESANNRLLVFSQDGHRLSTIGEPGTAPGQFKRPTDVAVGKDGRIYVVDQANHRIQIFKGFSFKSAAESNG